MVGAAGVSAQLVGKLQAEAQKARGEECECVCTLACVCEHTCVCTSVGCMCAHRHVCTRGVHGYVWLCMHMCGHMAMLACVCAC